MRAFDQESRQLNYKANDGKRQVARGEKVIQVGLAADEVLRLPGWGKSSAVRPPKGVSDDDGNLIVRWFYWDMILTLKCRDGCYQVAEIRECGLLGKMWWLGRQQWLVRDK